MKIVITIDFVDDEPPRAQSLADLQAWSDIVVGRTSVRAYKILKRAGVTNIKELAEIAENRLFSVKGCGEVSLVEIRELIAKAKEHLSKGRAA